MKKTDGGYVVQLLDGSEKVFETLVGADLRWARLKGVDLSDVNLSSANLRGANLRGTDLSSANLRWAILRGADLRGADISFTQNIIGFYLGKHFGFMVLDSQYVRIGCEGMSLDEWIESYVKIGEESGYSKLEIKAYGAQLKMLKEQL